MGKVVLNAGSPGLVTVHRETTLTRPKRKSAAMARKGFAQAEQRRRQCPICHVLCDYAAIELTAASINHPPGHGPYYSDVGRPSIDPELMIRMMIAGYCFGIRSERRLCDEVHLNRASTSAE